MKKELPENIKKIMEERFGKDSIIALATVEQPLLFLFTQLLCRFFLPFLNKFLTPLLQGVG